jgi:hypothetical protein
MARRCVGAWLRRESAVVVLRIEVDTGAGTEVADVEVEADTGADTGADTEVDTEVVIEVEGDYWSIHLALLCLY